MKRYFIAVCLLAAFALPTQSHAYESTQKTAIRLNDHTLLFFITYEFGHKQYDYRMPIAAVRGDGAGEKALGFDIVTNAGLRTPVGKTKSIVLSRAKVENGMYVVPKGNKAEFTLVTVFGLPAGYSASSTAFGVQVNSLPFELGSNGVFTHNGLTASELSLFKTMAVDTKLQ